MANSPLGEPSTARPLAIVTGASSGIGYELARQFGQHAFDLVIAAEDDAIWRAAESLRSLNVRVEPLQDGGVTVTALMPGPTETRFFERAGMTGTKLGQAEKDDPAQVAREGFEALMAGMHKVVAGSLKNKLEVKAAAVMPEPATAALQRQQLEKSDPAKGEPGTSDGRQPR